MAKFSKRRVETGDFSKIIEFRREKDPINKRLLAEKGFNAVIIKEEDSPVKKSIVKYNLHSEMRGGNAFVKTRILSYQTYKKEDKKYYESDSHRSDFLFPDWFTNYNIPTNKRIRKDILIGKITNQKTVFKKYFSSLGFKNLPYKKSLVLLDKMGRSQFLKILYCSNNPVSAVNEVHDSFDKFIVNWNNEKPPEYVGDILNDICKQSQLLDRKINFSWSKKRMNEVHSEWSNEITIRKKKMLRNEIIRYESVFPNIPYVELLVQTTDFLEEGETMRHCIFSNSYFNYAKDRERFYLKYDDGENRGTIEIEGVSVNGVMTLKLRQLKGFKNSNLPDNVNNFVNDLLTNSKVLKWASVNLGEDNKKSTKKEELTVDVNVNDDVFPF